MSWVLATQLWAFLCMEWALITSIENFLPPPFLEGKRAIWQFVFSLSSTHYGPWCCPWNISDSPSFQTQSGSVFFGPTSFMWSMQCDNFWKMGGEWWMSLLSNFQCEALSLPPARYQHCLGCRCLRAPEWLQQETLQLTHGRQLPGCLMDVTFLNAPTLPGSKMKN